MAIVGDKIECSQGPNDEMPVIILVNGTKISRSYEGVFGCGSGHLSKFQLDPSDQVVGDIFISKDKAVSDITKFKKKHIETIQVLPLIAKEYFSKFQNAYTMNETSDAAISLRLVIERFVYDNYCYELKECGNSVFNLSSIGLLLRELRYRNLEGKIQDEMDNNTNRGNPSYEERKHNYRCAQTFHDSIIQKNTTNNLLSSIQYGKIKEIYQECSIALHHVSGSGYGSAKLLEVSDILDLWDQFLNIMSSFNTKKLRWEEI